MIAVINEIAPNFIKWPSIPELVEDEKQFRKFADFPGVIEALDGCHIQITAPDRILRVNINKKYDHTVNHMAI